MATQGVTAVEADQCMYGLKTWSDNGGKLSLAKKPTRFMTNSRAMGRELERKCNGAHEHQPLVDGRASAASRYPQGLCRAICRGIVKAKMEREHVSALWQSPQSNRLHVHARLEVRVDRSHSMTAHLTAEVVLVGQYLPSRLSTPQH